MAKAIDKIVALYSSHCQSEFSCCKCIGAGFIWNRLIKLSHRDHLIAASVLTVWLSDVSFW